MATTYIVIEVAEKENAGDIVNILVTQTKARFTITKNLGEYAAERDKLAGTSGQSEQAPLPQNNDPAPIQEEAPQEIEDDLMMFVVPKAEQFVDSPEPSHANQVFEEASPINQYEQPVPDDNEYWQHEMETSASSAPGPVRSAARRKRYPSQKSTSSQCAICKTVVKVLGLAVEKRAIHAITHLDFKRYECSVKHCEFKSSHRSNVQKHMKVSHAGQPLIIRDTITAKQKADLQNMVEECFPEMRPKDTGNQWDDDVEEPVEEVTVKQERNK